MVLVREDGVYDITRSAPTMSGLLNGKDPITVLRAAPRDRRLGSLDEPNNSIIAWHTSGIRSIDDAKAREVPVPGDGRYEWAGLMPESQLPALHNPPKGFVATANQMNLPPANGDKK